MPRAVGLYGALPDPFTASVLEYASATYWTRPTRNYIVAGRPEGYCVQADQPSSQGRLEILCKERGPKKEGRKKKGKKQKRAQRMQHLSTKHDAACRARSVRNFMNIKTPKLPRAGLWFPQSFLQDLRSRLCPPILPVPATRTPPPATGLACRVDLSRFKASPVKVLSHRTHR